MCAFGHRTRLTTGGFRAEEGEGRVDGAVKSARNFCVASKHHHSEEVLFRTSEVESANCSMTPLLTVSIYLGLFIAAKHLADIRKGHR